MDDLIRLIEDTEANSRRLLTDAEVLMRLRRSHSSVSLAVQALEEFGKALILRWGVQNMAHKRPPNHVEKQSATFALLSAHELTDKNGKQLARLQTRDDVDLLNVGPYSHQFAQARAGFYENLRMSVTYEDKTPIFPNEVIEKISPGFAKEVIGYTKKARVAARKPIAMKLAAIFYTHNLARM